MDDVNRIMSYFPSMFRRMGWLMGWVLIASLTTSCVDLDDIPLTQRVNVIVVDGTITNLVEQQVIHINRSKSDSLTGRFGSLPIAGARVEVIVDSVQVVTFPETDTAGAYRAPPGFNGEVGHTYQLRFTLKDGTNYQSTVEMMQPIAAIQRAYARFNPTSLPARLDDGSINLYRGAHELFVDFQDPADQHNYYRWDWVDWEKQVWCRSCVQGYYLMYEPYSDNNSVLYENCEVDQSATFGGGGRYFIFDYNCRTQCWEILHNYTTNVFDDRYSNGGLITGRSVAQIPYYQNHGCLVQLRQSSLTYKAYQYYKAVEEQTQHTGGVADTPPTALIGNVHNVLNGRESVIGYFTASAVATTNYWIDRNDARGDFPTLFVALNGRPPNPEKDYPGGFGEFNSNRVPLAVCVPSDSRTPNKPVGWQE